MCDTTRDSPPPYQPPSTLELPAPYEPPSNSEPKIQMPIYRITITPTDQTTCPQEQNNERCSCYCKANPQTNLFNSAFLIFVTAGMNMAWKLGFAETFKTEFEITNDIIASWFYGGIIGAVIGAFICNFFQHKVLIWLSSIHVIVSGILQVSDPNSYDVILASRYFNGMALGMIFPVTFVLLGEESVKSARGVYAVFIEAIPFNCGLLLQIIISASWSNETEAVFEEIRLIGILSVICGVIAFVVAIYLIESPIFYLQHGADQLALDSLIRLQPLYNVDQTILEQFLEHIHYLAESKSKSFIQNLIYGLPALLKLCFYRSFMALGFSYIVNFTFTLTMYLTTEPQIYLYILYAFSRLLGSLIASFTLDSGGRKLSLIIGFFFSFAIAFTIGSMFESYLKFSTYEYMTAVKYLLIIFQFFAALSMASSAAYLSEAFPLPVKSYYIAIVFTVEMLIHILIISYKNAFNDNDHIYNIAYYFFFSLGGFLFAFHLLAIYVMPETAQSTLRECLPKFYKFINYHND